MIEVPAAKKECFFEDLHKNDKMTVTYQVGGGGHLDIDFWVRNTYTVLKAVIQNMTSRQLTGPDGHALHKHIKRSTGTVSITAEQDGRHEYCFSNQMSTVIDKLVSFNVHGVIFVDGDDTIAPIEREIRALAGGLLSVKDEQEYIVIRERTHRNTAESTNDRVKWWSVAQFIILFSVVGWQVYYLKSFFEVKRAF
ncbi:emp24/gp25L/p24 family/GOLD-domain-containing protein [Irpex rosettiformis]|uniref:Emp24/gp25L/p24 family/GOLD-domain-containing protein n=1 Tax=Irpex rosettiformis TaxID=378272 RepID=A0ACB8UEA4_9APHY|nr:emp24/gp25L/p24 family/GOLD-domain-containing protein [Irpex rosettiformis]